MRIRGKEVVKGQGYVSSLGRRNGFVSGDIKPIRGSSWKVKFRFKDMGKYRQLGYGTKVYFYESKRPDPGKLRGAVDIEIYDRPWRKR